MLPWHEPDLCRASKHSESKYREREWEKYKNTNYHAHHIGWSIFSWTNLRLRDGKMHFNPLKHSLLVPDYKSFNAAATTTTTGYDGEEDTTVSPQSALQWLSAVTAEEEEALSRFIHWLGSPGRERCQAGADRGRLWYEHNKVVNQPNVHIKLLPRPC